MFFSIFQFSSQYLVSLTSNISYYSFSLEYDIHSEKSALESHLCWQIILIINSGAEFNRYLFPLDYYLDVIHWFCPQRWNKIFTYLWKISSQKYLKLCIWIPNGTYTIIWIYNFRNIAICLTNSKRLVWTSSDEFHFHWILLFVY